MPLSDPTYTQSEIDELKSELRLVKENHLAHLQADVTALKIDMKWIKVIGGFLIVQGIAVLIQIFNIHR